MIRKISPDEIKHILYLSLSLAKVRFKLRNEGSFIGIFWYLLEPLLTFAILLLFGHALYQNIIPHYPLYLLVGLVVFNFFLAATNFSIKAITSNESFIKSMDIAKEPFVIAGLIQYSFSHACEIVLLLFLALCLKVPLTGFLVYPLFFLFFSLFVLGCSFLFATIGVYIKDLSNVWAVLGRLLWFATPIFYVAPKEGALYLINLFNPIFYFVSTARAIIINGQTLDLGTTVFVVLSSVLMFFLGLFSFSIRKKDFASRI
ncbi:MAG TPA: ABC transporter permease [Candidatus Omnitrophota bacterium]|nr:ABC transporter permease [Candidatus Omnitrophota bacterium]